MKLKNKLIISFLLIVLLPVLMVVIVYFGISAYMSVDVLRDIVVRNPQLQEFVVDMMVAFVLILIFTAVVLSWWTYTSIVTPIQRLQKAVQYIKEGKYNFSLDVKDTHDEISLLCNDFEEMRQMLKETAEKNLCHEKEGKELVRNISHDLKTPITSIKGYVEGILDGVASTKEKQDRYLKIILNKTNEMNSLINELSLYSKLDTDSVPYHFQPLSVKDYFDDCAEEIGIELREEGMTFQYENFCKEGTKILADAEQIKRVVSNIVGNSIKYTEKGRGHVRLSVMEEKQFVQIEIEDNGKGIAKGDLPYIFDRFFRTDESRNSSTGGSGIGLSIVKKIVEDHGGKIWATSEYGQGTTMFILLKKWTGSKDDAAGKDEDSRK